MQITTKYDIGDIVYTLGNNIFEHQVESLETISKLIDGNVVTNTRYNLAITGSNNPSCTLKDVNECGIYTNREQAAKVWLDRQGVQL